MNTLVIVPVQSIRSAYGTCLKIPTLLCQQRFAFTGRYKLQYIPPTQVISLVSVVLVIISTVAMCLNTMPEFKVKDSEGQRTLENPLFALIEAVCISWFTVEYLLRLAGAPAKGNFIKRPLNVVDVLAILPYYIGLGLDSARDVNDEVMRNVTMVETEQEPDTKFDEMSRIVMVFRIARILRIFKLARSSEGLQVDRGLLTIDQIILICRPSPTR